MHFVILSLKRKTYRVVGVITYTSLAYFKLELLPEIFKLFDLLLVALVGVRFTDKPFNFADSQTIFIILFRRVAEFD